MSYADKIGEYSTPKEGFRYAITDVTVKNIGTTDVSVSSSNAALKDSEGFTYDSTYASVSKEFIRQKLVPGDAARGNVVFEIPIAATGLKLIYTNSAYPASSRFVLPFVSSTPSGASSTQTPQATPTPTPTPIPTLPTVFSSCGFSVDITSGEMSGYVTYTDKSGKSDLLVAQSGQKLVHIKAGIYNGYTNKITTGSEDFEGTDETGKKYSLICPVDTYGNCKTGTTWTLPTYESLLTSQRISGNLVFSVPGTIKEFKLYYEVPSALRGGDCNAPEFFIARIPGGG